MTATDNLIVEYPVQTVCHGTVMQARRIFKVLMRPLSFKKVQIHLQGDALFANRKSRQNIIYVDFYAKKQEVEGAVKQLMQEKFHVNAENLTLRWKKGDLFTHDTLPEASDYKEEST
jgi:uncharacterized protein YlbG (UPF0298 family)